MDTEQNTTFVIVESPYGAASALTRDLNVAYARSCLLNSIRRHFETPFASHLFYTQVLNDEDPSERDLGISMGHNIMARADAVVFYMDRGLSRGMYEGFLSAQQLGRPVSFRSLFLSSSWAEHFFIEEVRAHYDNQYALDANPDAAVEAVSKELGVVNLGEKS